MLGNLLLLYLAFTAHFVALSQALLLGGSGGLPGLDEVTQCDMHRPVGLQFSCGGGREHVRGRKTGQNKQWLCMFLQATGDVET